MKMFRLAILALTFLAVQASAQMIQVNKDNRTTTDTADCSCLSFPNGIHVCSAHYGNHEPSIVR